MRRKKRRKKKSAKLTKKEKELVLNLFSKKWFAPVNKNEPGHFEAFCGATTIRLPTFRPLLALPNYLLPYPGNLKQICL
jgi:hypothetical protein